MFFQISESYDDVIALINLDHINTVSFIILFKSVLYFKYNNNDKCCTKEYEEVIDSDDLKKWVDELCATLRVIKFIDTIFFLLMLY